LSVNSIYSIKYMFFAKVFASKDQLCNLSYALKKAVTSTTKSGKKSFRLPRTLGRGKPILTCSIRDDGDHEIDVLQLDGVVACLISNEIGFHHDGAQKFLHICKLACADHARSHYGDVIHAHVCFHTVSGLATARVSVKNVDQIFPHSWCGVGRLDEHLVLLHLACVDGIQDKESQAERSHSFCGFVLFGAPALGIVTTTSGPVMQIHALGFRLRGLRMQADKVRTALSNYICQNDFLRVGNKKRQIECLCTAARRPSIKTTCMFETHAAEHTHTHTPVVACHPSKEHACSKRTPQNTHTRTGTCVPSIKTTCKFETHAAEHTHKPVECHGMYWSPCLRQCRPPCFSEAAEAARRSPRTQPVGSSACTRANIKE